MENLNLTHFTQEEIDRAQSYKVRDYPECVDPKIDELVRDLISGFADKWTMMILDVLWEEGPLRFSQHIEDHHRPLVSKAGDQISDQLIDLRIDALGIVPHLVGLGPVDFFLREVGQVEILHNFPISKYRTFPCLLSFGERVNNYIKAWRQARERKHDEFQSERPRGRRRCRSVDATALGHQRQLGAD